MSPWDVLSPVGQQTANTTASGHGMWKSSHLPEEEICTNRETTCYRIMYFCKVQKLVQGELCWSCPREIPQRPTQQHRHLWPLLPPRQPKSTKIHTFQAALASPSVSQNKSWGQGSVLLHFLNSSASCLGFYCWCSQTVSNLFVPVAIGELQCALLGTAGPDTIHCKGKGWKQLNLQPNKWTGKRKET